MQKTIGQKESSKEKKNIDRIHSISNDDSKIFFQNRFEGHFSERGGGIQVICVAKNNIEDRECSYAINEGQFRLFRAEDMIHVFFKMKAVYQSLSQALFLGILNLNSYLFQGFNFLGYLKIIWHKIQDQKSKKEEEDKIGHCVHFDFML